MLLVMIMKMLKRSLSLALVIMLSLPAIPPAHASAYDSHPKLVIVLVIDQFREDYLERYRDELKGRGFRLFLDKGAYFPDCYYDYANTKTAPGHSTLGTGAYTDGHGIGSNDWWDLSRNKTRPITSVEDERYQLVGLINASNTDPGASPLNLRASTVGDELRLATQGRSLVYGISLKDRAAILPTGASANGAFWIDESTGTFITSTYYMTQLPKWATAFNGSDRAAQAIQESGADQAGKDFYKPVGRTPAANSYELDFAKALITGEQLGKHPTTDLLSISLSAPDLAGHNWGPDSPEQHAMVLALDSQLDSFFTWLDKNIDGGLANVWIAFSADHGVAPVPAQAATLGLPAAVIDVDKLVGGLNDAMNAKFSPGEKVVYILPKQELPYLSLNRPAFEVAGINELEAEQAVQAAVDPAFTAIAPAPTATIVPAPYEATLPAPAAPALKMLKGGKAAVEKPATKAATKAARNAKTPIPEEIAPPTPPPSRYASRPYAMHTFTRLDLASGQLPPSEFGTLMAHSYNPNGGWYVMIIPGDFEMDRSKNPTWTTHYTPYSYDRHVPLAFFGTPFTPGIYHGRVEPVDLAATLASMLGVNQPSASVGHILTQAIHPVLTAPVRPVRHPHPATPDAAEETPQ
jgi:hypothetical protein